MKPEGHSEIAKAAVAVLEQAAPGEDFTYFYFGNWLTDVSQVRSPVDAATALPAVRRKVLEAAVEQIQRVTGGYLPAVEQEAAFQTADRLADRVARLLLGEMPVHVNYRTGRLAEYVSAGVFINGYLKYCYPPALAAIDFDEYCRVFDARFTQYYPHEHVDRFPRNESRSSAQGRDIYQYLEEDIDYVAELLTLVEMEWAAYHVVKANLDFQRATIGDVDPSAVALLEAMEAHQEQKRRDLLIEFGHAIHAVEDFFAHSNFVEFCMELLGIDAKGKLGEEYGFTGSNDARERSQRRYRLRLKRELSPSPRGETLDGYPIPPGKLAAEIRVVTGSFDSIDSSVAIHGAMESILEKPLIEAILVANEGVPNQGTSDPRARMRRLDHRPAAVSEQNRQQVRDEWAKLFREEGRDVPPRVQDARQRIQDVDWELYDVKNIEALMVSNIIAAVVEEGGRRAAEPINPRDPGVTWAMRPGTHSLLAKDSLEGNPGYTQALNLAKRVSTYIAELMTRNFSATPHAIATSHDGDHATIDRARWIDWAELLRYFVDHPRNAPAFAVPHESRALLVRLEESANFEFDSDVLSEHAQTTLDGLAEQILANPDDLMVSIEGHTCTLGTRAHNEPLSERRAESVAQHLMDRGVDPSVLRTGGFGASVPLASNATEAGRRQNRRVEVYAAFRDQEPKRETQWWRECINDPGGLHGHAPRLVSPDEARRRKLLGSRTRLESAYDTRAPIEEAEYGAWRSAGDAHIVRETVTLVQGETSGRHPQTQRFSQDNVDYGAVRVHCRQGLLRVVGTSEIWRFSPRHVVDVSLAAGQSWADVFHAEGAVFDQQNMIVLEGRSGTTICDFEMISYDLRPSLGGA